MMLLMLVGFVISCVFAYNSASIGNNFKSSYNVRYEYDVYSRSEDPTKGYYSKENVKLDEVTANAKKMAKAYSSFLLDRGISNGNVYPEVYMDSDNVIHCYINATIDNAKVQSADPLLSDKEQNKCDIAPSLAYINSMLSNRYNIIYCDGYTDNDNSGENFNSAKLYMWTLNGYDDSLVDSDAKITADYQNNKINLHLRDTYSFGDKKTDNDKEYVDGSIKEIFYKAKNDKTTDNLAKDPVEKYPFMWIIRDLRTMINHMEYVLYIYGIYNDKFNNYEDLDKELARTAYFQLSKSEAQFASDVLDKQENFDYYVHDGIFNEITSFANDKSLGFQDEPYKGLLEKTNVLNTTANVVNPSNANRGPYNRNGNDFLMSRIFSLIQDNNGKTPYSPTPGKNTTIKYDFLKPYILGVVTRDNYTDYLPDKTPNNSENNSKGQWLTIKNDASYFTTSEIYRQLTSEKFAYPIKDIIYQTDEDAGKNSITNFNSMGLSKNNNINISIVNNAVSGSAILKNSVITSFVAVGLIALIIGLIVSILYRIPGLVVYLSQLLPIGVTLLLLFTFGFSLSITTILTVIIGLITSSFAGINLLNKIKKEYLCHKTLDQAIFSTYSKSFFTCLDPYAISFIVGACLLFFPSGQLFSFGISLIVLSGISFISLYLLSWLTNALIFINEFGMYKYRWFSRLRNDQNNFIHENYVNKLTNQVNKMIENGFDKEGYTSYKKLSNPFSLNKKFNWISLIIIGLVLVSGLVLFLTSSPTYAFDFYGGTRIMVFVNNADIVTWAKIYSLLPNKDSWHNILTPSNGTSNVFFYLETSLSFKRDEIVAALMSLNTQVFVQSIDPTVTLQLTYHCIYALMAFIGFMAIYSLIRYKWHTVIAIVISNIIIQLMCVSLLFIVHISFNVFISYAFIFIALISNLFIFGLMNAVYTRWFNKNPTVYTDLITLMRYGINNYTENSHILRSLIILANVIAIIFMPINLISVFVIVLISLVAIYLVNNSVLVLLLYSFINIHNIYQLRIKRVQGIVNKRNFDKIDEELIQGINFNAKAIE